MTTHNGNDLSNLGRLCYRLHNPSPQKSESDVKDKTDVVMLKTFAGLLLLPTKENCENILLIISVVAPFVCGFCKNVVRLEMTRVRQAGRQAGVGPARTRFFFLPAGKPNRIHALLMAQCLPTVHGKKRKKKK